MSEESKPKAASAGEVRRSADGRFLPGCSGNRRGRPKAADHSLDTIVTQELGRTIPVTIDGKRQKIKMIFALVKKQVRDALNGDKKALDFVQKHYKWELLESDNFSIDQNTLENLTVVELSELYEKAIGQ